MKEKKIIFIASFLILLCSSSNTHILNDNINVDAFCSYNGMNLPPTIFANNNSTAYDSIIKSTLNLIGLPDTDIEIDTTVVYGAFAVINKNSQRRFFIYSPIFFDSVYFITNTKYAIMSICFHELAHQLYNHPLKPSYASLIYEKQADRYSGYQMCIIGGTLEQSLIAMKYFGNNLETPSHPDKATRLAEIEKGYTSAKINVFKDSSYIKKDSISKSKELLYTMFYKNSLANEIKNNKYLMYYDSDYIIDKAYKKSNSKSVYTLYGELIYFTSDLKVKLLSNNKIIGNLLESENNKMFSKIINLEGVLFYLDYKQNIFSINPDGSKLEAGNILLN